MSTLLKDPFQYFLDEFHKIIKGMPPISKVTPELLKLKESATANNELTFAQKDAILARCDNYIKGDYGSQRDSKSQIDRMAQFQKMRGGKFSANGAPENKYLQYPGKAKAAH